MKRFRHAGIAAIYEYPSALPGLVTQHMGANVVAWVFLVVGSPMHRGMEGEKWRRILY